MANIGRIELLILSMFCAIPIIIAVSVLVIAWLLRRDRVPCPYCGERIRREARVCRFGGRDVEPAAGERYGSER